MNSTETDSNPKRNLNNLVGIGFFLVILSFLLIVFGLATRQTRHAKTPGFVQSETGGITYSASDSYQAYVREVLPNGNLGHQQFVKLERCNTNGVTWNEYLVVTLTDTNLYHVGDRVYVVTACINDSRQGAFSYFPVIQGKVVN